MIASNKLTIIMAEDSFIFGVLTSSAHMAWTRVVAGRLKSDYQYSGGVVYNNFPWPDADEESKAKIRKTAQQILDARNKSADTSLADLYNELTMPIELRKAHEANDKAVLAAYGLKKDATEEEIVAHLFTLYADKVKGQKNA